MDLYKKITEGIYKSKMCACMLSYFSRVQLSATLWTAACQAPLSMRFSRQAQILMLVIRKMDYKG